MKFIYWQSFSGNTRIFKKSRYEVSSGGQEAKNTRQLEICKFEWQLYWVWKKHPRVIGRFGYGNNINDFLCENNINGFGYGNNIQGHLGLQKTQMEAFYIFLLGFLKGWRGVCTLLVYMRGLYKIINLSLINSKGS